MALKCSLVFIVILCITTILSKPLKEENSQLTEQDCFKVCDFKYHQCLIHIKSLKAIPECAKDNNTCKLICEGIEKRKTIKF